jgi:hypothetical protein
VSGEINSDPAKRGVSGVASQPEPIEPLEDRIAPVISETLEPFVVSLLAALISPSQCVQGIDEERDDQRRKAIRLAQRLLSETRTNLQKYYADVARYTQGLEEQKQQVELKLAQDYLFLDLQLGDDSFRQYLREHSASAKIRDRDAVAHYRTFGDLGIGGLLTAKHFGGKVIGYHLSRHAAEEYLKRQRRKVSDATARSRSGKPTKKIRSSE